MHLNEGFLHSIFHKSQNTTCDYISEGFFHIFYKQRYCMIKIALTVHLRHQEQSMKTRVLLFQWSLIHKKLNGKPVSNGSTFQHFHLLYALWLNMSHTHTAHTHTHLYQSLPLACLLSLLQFTNYKIKRYRDDSLPVDSEKWVLFSTNLSLSMACSLSNPASSASCLYFLDRERYRYCHEPPTPEQKRGAFYLLL